MMIIDGYKLDDLAVEAFCELRADQNPKDILKYLDVATEGISNPQTRVKLVNRLYDDLMKKGFIDFDKIPLSKGDFTKYVHFQNLTKSIENMEKLFKGISTPEFELTQKLYNMIISCRADFEYGFKYDIELIMFSYNTLVLALHRILDIAMLSYIRHIRVQNDTPSQSIIQGITKKATNVALNFKYAHATDMTPAATAERLLIIEGVEKILKMYDKGEWTQMINSFKKGRNNWLGVIGQIAGHANLVADLGPMMVATPQGVAVVTVVTLIVFIISLRKIIYVFYSTAYKIDESVKRNKQFVEYTLQHSLDQSTDAILKQEKILEFYNRINDTIESKVFAENTKASKNLKAANKARFTIADIGPDNFDQARVDDEPRSQYQSTYSSYKPPTPSQPSNSGNNSEFTFL